MQFFRKNLAKRAAESLIEVIMAIFVIGVGSTVATSLVMTALQSNLYSRDNLIALNLAEEGLEAVRSVRDANWLRYGSDKEQCWNMMPKSASNCPDPAAATNDVIRTGNYTVDLDSQKWLWDLTNVINNPVLNLENQNAAPTNQEYLLYLYDNGINGSNPLYISKNAFHKPEITPKDTKFYRMVSIDYKKDGVDVNADDAQIMNVTSFVQWQASGKIYQVQLKTSLTNYQKVKVTP